MRLDGKTNHCYILQLWKSQYRFYINLEKVFNYLSLSLIASAFLNVNNKKGVLL